MMSQRAKTRASAAALPACRTARAWPTATSSAASATKGVSLYDVRRRRLAVDWATVLRAFRFEYLYKTDGQQPACVDVNECTIGQHRCDENALCINEVGSYRCVCKSGHVGDGFTCQSESSFSPIVSIALANKRPKADGSGPRRPRRQFQSFWNATCCRGEAVRAHPLPGQRRLPRRRRRGTWPVRLPGRFRPRRRGRTVPARGLAAGGRDRRRRRRAAGAGARAGLLLRRLLVFQRLPLRRRPVPPVRRIGGRRSGFAIARSGHPQRYPGPVERNGQLGATLGATDARLTNMSTEQMSLFRGKQLLHRLIYLKKKTLLKPSAVRTTEQ